MNGTLTLFAKVDFLERVNSIKDQWGTQTLR